MTPTLVFFILISYFFVLVGISVITSRGANSEIFFTANRMSPWYLVAFGMIGTSLSGVTFISVPGNVGKVGFSYFQIVLGYLVGYWVIILILMPLFYKLRLTSIYTYLHLRFDEVAHKTGSFFFLLSRTIGSSLRLFLTATVLQIFLFQAWGIPFYVTVAITIILIWVYTFRGGIKTIVWTDTFQTFFLVLTVVLSIVIIIKQLDLSWGDLIPAIRKSQYAHLFYFNDVKSTLFFPKQFFGGALIAIAMTGLDQDLMQKNLTCKNLRDAQKNMFWFSLILVLVNVFFLVLGALLYMYSAKFNIVMPESKDELFPLLALNHFGLTAGVFFLLGIIASTYSSADSALTALTTSFCIDFLNFKGKKEALKEKQKNRVHLSFCVLFFTIILIFNEVNESSLIDAVLTLAGYTYGPLLGLFSFGIFTQRTLRGKWTLLICLLAPICSYLLVLYSKKLFGGYQIGIEVIGINGLLTFVGLYLTSIKDLHWDSKKFLRNAQPDSPLP